MHTLAKLAAMLPKTNATTWPRMDMGLKNYVPLSMPSGVTVICLPVTPSGTLTTMLRV